MKCRNCGSDSFYRQWTLWNTEELWYCSNCGVSFKRIVGSNYFKVLSAIPHLPEQYKIKSHNKTVLLIWGI